MKVKFVKTTAVLAAAVVLASGSITTLAAEPDASYSYRAGQERNASRKAKVQKLDVEELVEAGVLDQETADRIAELGSKKHDAIHARYEGKAAAATPTERHTFYEGFAAGRTEGNSVSRLVEAGVITQEQADAIEAYLAGK